MIWPATSDNFENLYSLIPAIPAGMAHGVLIAISVLASYAEDILKNLEGEIRFIPPDSNWTLLGYDVADDGFISGLSNCGYEPVEKRRWQAEWNPEINQHGLISNASEALKFKLQADKRVVEHSPFFVFGLYLVEPTNK